MCSKKPKWLIVMYDDNDEFEIIKTERVQGEKENTEVIHRNMTVMVDGCRKAVIAALSDIKKPLQDGYCELTDLFRNFVKESGGGFQPTKQDESNAVLPERHANKAEVFEKTLTANEKREMFFEVQYKKIKRERDDMYFKQKHPKLMKKFDFSAITKDDHKVISNIENNPEVTYLGPNGTKIATAEVRNFKWENRNKVISRLLEITFGREVLAKSFLIGNRPACFKDRKPKPALDPKIVEDVVYFITKTYDVKSQSEITDIITAKCAYEYNQITKRGLPMEKCANKTI